MFTSQKLPNYAERDTAIAINSYTTVLRRSSIAQELFHSYWRDVHGPLCARIPGLGWYVQHHFKRYHDDHLWVLPEGIQQIPNYPLDGMVEIGFASVADQNKFKEASPILFDDEQNVFDETLAYNLPSGSLTYVDRLEDPAPNGNEINDRIHVHLHASHKDLNAFGTYMSEAIAKPFSQDPSVLKLRLHLPKPHEHENPNPPSPDVDHAAVQLRTTLAMLEIVFADPLARRRFLASERFRSSLSEQNKHVSHISAFSVSGVYTFVRDGQLTTAGLRGSRAAAMINELGAINQVSQQVETLMKTGRLSAD
jgi:hypothetical protein